MSQDKIVGLFRHGEQEHRGVVVQLGAGAVLLDFPDPEAPRLPIGAEVVVLFSGGPIRSPLEVPCRLVYRGEGEGICRLRMQLDPEVDTAISNLFSRRGAYRVVPITDSPVPVELGIGSGRSVGAVIKDISRAGMGVLVPTEKEKELYGAQELTLRFHLPGIEEPFEVPAVVRYRSLVGSAIQYGLEFIPARASEFARFEDRLTSYTMRCQAEILRRLRVKPGG